MSNAEGLRCLNARVTDTTCCACSAGRTAGGNALGVVRDGRPSRTGTPAGAGRRNSASAKPCSWTTPSAGPSTSTRRASGCPSPATRSSGWPGCCDVPELVTPAGRRSASPCLDGEFTWIAARAEWAGRRGPSGTRRWPRSTRWPARRPARAGSTPGPGRTRRREGPCAGLPAPRRRHRRGRGHRRGGAAADAELGRALNIRQGTGSQILTAPHPDGTIDGRWAGCAPDYAVGARGRGHPPVDPSVRRSAGTPRPARGRPRRSARRPACTRRPRAASPGRRRGRASSSSR